MADATEQHTTSEATPQEVSSVTEATVTDSELSSAWDNAQSETQVSEQVETIQQEEQTQGEESVNQEPEHEQHEEPVDNADRSRLGRRLKNLEDNLNKLIDKLGGQVVEQQQVQQQSTKDANDNVTFDDTFIQNQIETAIEEGRLPATIVTPQDQIRVNNFINGLNQYMGNQYTVKYLSTLKSPTLKGQTPDDIHAEVISELQNVQSPFNLRRYDNPLLDAKVNYLEAKTAILQKRLESGKVDSVFKGKPKGSPASGTSVSTRGESVSDELPTLDAASMDFIRRTGMSDESVRTALGKDIPLHLKGRGYR